MRQPRRTGLTVVELLVVIAIIAVLIGMLLPAVQKAREAASRGACQNNLKQIAFACHSYHDANKTLPPGIDYEAPYVYWSWMAKILPYIEQDAVFHAADDWARKGDVWKTVTPAVGWDAWGPPKDPNPAVATPIAMFICSSDPRSQVAEIPGGLGPDLTDTVALTSYLGVSGVKGIFLSPASDTMNGTLFSSSNGYWTGGATGAPPVRLSQITDGTSSTLLIGERPPYDSTGWGGWFASVGWDGSGSADVVLGACEVDMAEPPCTSSQVGLQPGDVSDPCHLLHFWSFHPGGASFAFADASVRFIVYNPAMSGPDNKLLQALATRAGGEIIPGY